MSKARRRKQRSRTRSSSIVMSVQSQEESTEQKPEQSQEAVEPRVPAAGSTIPATTTIDAIMTSLWATRSSDLAATPVYTWVVPGLLTATWPASTTQSGQSAQMIARFEVRPVAPSTIAP
jgi:hypothetical protein